MQQVQHFWHKYISQRVLKQIPEVGDYNKQPLKYKMEIPGGEGGWGTKVKVPSVGAMDIFPGTAQ